RRSSGIVFVNMTKPKAPFCNGPEDIQTTAIVQVTDIGITAKFSWNNSMIWATRLSTGRPVAGAKVSVFDHFNRRAWTGVTDGKGVARAPGTAKLFPEANYKKNHGEEIYVAVEKKGDAAFLSSEWNDGIELWNFDVDPGYYEGVRTAAGYIFSERDIYRPGETSHVKGIVRWDLGGKYKTPDGGKVRLTIRDDEGRDIYDKTFRLNGYGSFSGDAKIPLNARPGYYTLEARPSGARNSIYGEFRVEEYRPPEFELSFSTDKKEYVFGDKARGAVAAKYLFGAPMGGGKLEWTVSQTVAWFDPPGHEGYVFNDTVWDPDDESDTAGESIVSYKEAKLDSKGKFSATIPLKQGAKPLSRNYMFEAVVTDVNRQVVAERGTTLVHAGEFYVGLKPDKTFLKSGETLNTRVIAVSPGGKNIEGKKIRLKLYRRDWHTVLREELGSDWYYESKPVDKEVGSCGAVTGKSAALCSFKIARNGYFFVSAKAVDSRGNTITAAFDLYALGSDYVSWERRDSSRIQLVADRKKYKPGDTATIIVKSPYQSALALVTTEREKIFSSKVVELKGSAPTIKVPVEQSQIPNFGVSVVLIKGRTSQKLDKIGKDVGKPSFFAGYVNLGVDGSSRKLRVGVKPARKNYRPGDKVSLKIETKDNDGKGRSAEAAVMVVDEGVLSLTGFKTPDPFTAFYSEKGISVRTATSYIHVIDRFNYGKKGKNPGGSGKGGEGYDIATRNFFLTCAYWNPSVITDSKGKAEVSFKLPDNLTKYRIMVVAGTKGADFGSGRNYLRVSKPLMIRPALPRFAVAGDEFTAGAVVHNNGKTGGAATLRVASSGLRVLGKDVQIVRLAPGAPAEVKFKFRADAAGKASVTFIADFGGKSDSVRVSIPVKTPAPTETVASYGVTSDAVRRKVISPMGVRKDVGGLTVMVSSSAVAGLEQSVKSVVEYPYGCVEQTVSRGLPLLALAGFSDSFNFKSMKPEELKRRVRESLDRLSLFQKTNGGMSFWEDTACDSPYLSAYAYMFAVEAARAGYRVDSGMRKKLEKYLEGLVRGKVKPSCDEKLDPSTEAFILYVLANGGVKLSSYYQPLYDKREELGVWGRAFLAAAIYKSGKDRALSGDLMKYVRNRAKMTASEAHLEDKGSSDSLDSAMRSDT
ncbi:MAG TPA: MG2 domain-containing protein, partial [bacterium]|nr:MG2 domain-containing protein [bacterium]